MDKIWLRLMQDLDGHLTKMEQSSRAKKNTLLDLENSLDHINTLLNKHFNRELKDETIQSNNSRKSD